jgi:hypothetical protein
MKCYAKMRGGHRFSEIISGPRLYEPKKGFAAWQNLSSF